MEAGEGQPFFFQTEYRAERHSHYGRFLRLVPNKLVEITWMTGKGGTEGAETVLTVEFIPEKDGTRVKLAHRGFPHEQARAQHGRHGPWCSNSRKRNWLRSMRDNGTWDRSLPLLHPSVPKDLEMKNVWQVV